MNSRRCVGQGGRQEYFPPETGKGFCPTFPQAFCSPALLFSGCWTRSRDQEEFLETGDITGIVRVAVRPAFAGPQ